MKAAMHPDSTPTLRSLKEEIRQNLPFRSPGQEARLALMRTVDDLEHRSALILQPAGITHQQYNVLRILRGAAPEGLPTLAIAERMIERTPGITRLVDRLLKKGWVERQRSASDRRQVVCHITDRGLELLAQLDGPINREDDIALAMLSEDEQRLLIDLLARIRSGLADRCAKEECAAEPNAAIVDDTSA